MQRELGLSDTSLKRAIRRLKELEVINRVGGTSKNGYWNISVIDQK